jgi:hypothetical protein
VLHSLDSNDSPVQFIPPYIGVGLVHDRFLSDVPIPHGLLQNIQGLQFVKPPSTARNRTINVDTACKATG